MMNSTVTIARSRDYSKRDILAALRACLSPLGGIERYVKRGDRVLIKPNLLSAKKPERAITTHPVVVRCLAEIIKEEGGIPVIGDSPAGVEKGIQRLWRETGMLDAAGEAGADLLNFESGGTVEKTAGGMTYHVTRLLDEVDAVINVPKLKTHSLTLYTGALKNTFGTIPGFQKTEFHKLKPSAAEFSRVLADVFSLVRPSLNIMDAVVAMEGEGPASGKPRDVGMLVASDDGVALDALVSRMIGLSGEEVDLINIAAGMGLGNADLRKVEIHGALLDELSIEGFALPSNRTYRRLAPLAIRALGGFVWIRPVEERETCTLCRVCVNNCPVSAIAVNRNSLKFDYSKCIDCMCCHEICPENAIKLKKSFLAKVIL